ncbi:MAG: hypothetical protein JWR14_7630 [Caballeronia sp.]|jgi:hypothetical protein|nr:hypothetical protein [Caballeronia sp.]
MVYRHKRRAAARLPEAVLLDVFNRLADYN